jgi:KTSC domain
MEKVTQTELVPVESSNIAAVGYDGGTLTLAFHGGRIYRCYGVSAEVYHDLIDAPSKGRYLLRSIKGTYPVERVEVD